MISSRKDLLILPAHYNMAGNHVHGQHDHGTVPPIRYKVFILISLTGNSFCQKSILPYLRHHFMIHAISICDTIQVPEILLCRKRCIYPYFFCELGNALLCRLSLRYVELRLSIALVVYITLLTSEENLKIGVMASQLRSQLFMAFGYFSPHFALTLSLASSPFFSSGALYMVFRSLAKDFLSLSDTYLSVFLT